LGDKKKKIVTIGGGKGQGTILQGLCDLQQELDISAIISTFDNGGSTGRLRQELQIPSFGGDFRDVMTGLSKNQALVELFQHRYESGSEIKGHSVGNLILLGLLEMSDWNMPKAIKIAKKILGLKAEILPSTLDNVNLVAEFEDRSVIEGQNQIDDDMAREYSKITNIYTYPVATAYKGAIKAIKDADAIILCPGDLYGSLLCNIVVKGISGAIQSSKASLVYIVNLMTKVNQTKGWKSSDFVKEVQKYLPRKIDYAIINTAKLSASSACQKRYKQESWGIVKNDLKGTEYKGTKLIKGSFSLERKEFKRVSSDVIPRSFIRHDPAKIASIIMDLIL
jgi:uncharacterized cofD-like protein